jgi:GntR family transcriptional regulator
MPLNARSTPQLSRAPGTALHRQLFLVLRDQIARGMYAPGSSLPTEKELCERFIVSRITVRRALSDLEQEGFVEKHPGRGTFVRGTLSQARPAATLSLLESLSKQAQETSVKVLSVEVTDAPREIAMQLELAQEERAVHASRLRYAGKTMLMVTEAWLPERFGKGVSAAGLKKQALYELLLAQGVKFGRVVQEITAVAAEPQYAQLLQVGVGSPLLRLTRLLYDLDKAPVQHLTVHVCPERSRILMDLSIETMNTLSAGHVSHDLARLNRSK